MTPKKAIPVETQTRRVSDVVWQALIAGIVTCVITYFQYRNSNKVEDVRTTLEKTTTVTDEKLDDIAEVGTETHRIVNSGSVAMLRLYAIAMKRIADNSQDPLDIEAAELAEKEYREREARQKQLDSSQKADGNEQ